MLIRMRSEIDAALQNNLPLSAMIAALSLLDGVSKVEYPNVNSQAERYKRWWDTFVKTDVLDGATVYQIRCFVMHETKMALQSSNIPILALCLKSTPQCFAQNSILRAPDGTLLYAVDAQAFCMQVSAAFDNYYKTHQTIVRQANNQLFVIDEAEMQLMMQDPARAYQEIEKQTYDAYHSNQIPSIMLQKTNNT